jgi:hypothetical protein
VNADDPLARAIGEWRRKHHIADGDPMIAALELVRIYLKHSREINSDPATSPPSFENFRGTVELLDGRSKAFIHQATDLVAELRRFGHNVNRINRARFITHCVFIGLGALAADLGIRAIGFCKHPLRGNADANFCHRCVRIIAGFTDM